MRLRLGATVPLADAVGAGVPLADAAGAGVPLADATGAGVPLADAAGAGVPLADAAGAAVDALGAPIEVEAEVLADVLLLLAMLGGEPLCDDAGDTLGVTPAERLREAAEGERERVRVRVRVLVHVRVMDALTLAGEALVVAVGDVDGLPVAVTLGLLVPLLLAVILVESLGVGVTLEGVKLEDGVALEGGRVAVLLRVAVAVVVRLRVMVLVSMRVGEADTLDGVGCASTAANRTATASTASSRPGAMGRGPAKRRGGAGGRAGGQARGVEGGWGLPAERVRRGGVSDGPRRSTSDSS